MIKTKTNSVGNFPEYRVKCLRILEQILADAAPGSLDEQAFPAYVRGNPLSRWLFWRRIKFAFGYAQRFASDSAHKEPVALDFGCGSGLMLPQLEAHFSKVYGVDVELPAARRFLGTWYRKSEEPFADNLQLLNNVMSPELPAKSVDLILALDVLEHIPDLEPFFRRFAEVLKPGGVLLVSGPTENILYRTGRKIVGFSGHYHVHNIAGIRDVMARFLDVRIIRKLYFPASLFWILEAKPRS